MREVLIVKGQKIRTTWVITTLMVLVFSVIAQFVVFLAASLLWPLAVAAAMIGCLILLIKLGIASSKKT
jgi:membrane protein YdbS with pleckstrin-like domain